MQNKDKGDGIEDSLLDMLLVILLEGASMVVVTPSSSRNLYRINLVGLGYASQVPKLSSSFTSMLVIRITESYGSFMIWLVAYNGVNYLPP